MSKLPIPDDLHINTSFSTTLPGLQTAIDSTSIGSLKTCARKYYYEIICGYRQRAESVHLTFGTLLHEALELYDRKKLVDGLSHLDATCETVKFLLIATWNPELKRPWPSDDKYKNRETLIRTVVWYLDQFAEDPLETLMLHDGKPALELSFQLPLGYGPRTPSSEYILCGHLDRVVRFQDQPWIVDRKTTKYSLGDDYFQKYTPENQMSTYAVAGQIILGERVGGLIVDAAQVAVNFSRFRRGIISRTPAQLEEWLLDLKWWLSAAETYAENQYWPQNDKSCSMYGGCPFLSICGNSPEVRQIKLDTMYVKRIWNPLKSREI